MKIDKLHSIQLIYNIKYLRKFSKILQERLNDSFVYISLSLSYDFFLSIVTLIEIRFD